jgi:radical SAM protein with 4Fe4S-binding SPASM domain
VIDYIKIKRRKNFIYDTDTDSWYISENKPKNCGTRKTKTVLPTKLLEKPRFLEIVFNTSYRCNLDCDYCYMHKDNGREPIKKTLDLLLEQLKKADRPTRVLFHGGEPLQYFNLIKDFIERCEGLSSEQPIVFQLQTNATLISKDIAIFLKRHKFLVCVSIDGLKGTTDAHRKFHNGRGAFNEIIRGIDNLKKQKVRFTTISVLTNEFGEAYRTNIKFLRSLGSQKYQINPLTGANSKFDQVSATKVFNYILDDELSNRPECKEASLSLRLLSLIGVDEGDACVGLPCDMGRSVISVDSYGDIYPCEMFSGDRRYAQGNISRYNLFDYWKSHELRLFQERVVEASRETCGDCPLARYRTCACSFNILSGNRRAYHSFAVSMMDKLVDAIRYKQSDLKKVIADA